MPSLLLLRALPRNLTPLWETSANILHLVCYFPFKSLTWSERKVFLRALLVSVRETAVCPVIRLHRGAVMLRLMLLRRLPKLPKGGGSRDNFPGWWFDERKIFQCQYLTVGSGSVFRRWSSLLAVRNSRGTESLALSFFSWEPLYHQSECWAWGGADLKGPVWLWKASLYSHTWRCSISTFLLDCGRDRVWFIYLFFKSPVFQYSRGRSPWRCKGGPPGGKRKGGYGIRR